MNLKINKKDITFFLIYLLLIIFTPLFIYKKITNDGNYIVIGFLFYLINISSYSGFSINYLYSFIKRDDIFGNEVTYSFSIFYLIYLFFYILLFFFYKKRK